MEVVPRKKKKRGFTDKCFIFYTIVWLCILIAGEVITILSDTLGIADLSVINTIIEKSTEAMMVFIGFFVWKTKAENMKKLGNSDKVEM